MAILSGIIGHSTVSEQPIHPAIARARALTADLGNRKLAGKFNADRALAAMGTQEVAVGGHVAGIQETSSPLRGDFNLSENSLANLKDATARLSGMLFTKSGISTDKRFAVVEDAKATALKIPNASPTVQIPDTELARNA